MIKGIQASKSGMAWEQTRSDAIAHNVANVNTDAFKRSVAVGREFEALLLERLGDAPPGGEKPPAIGQVSAGAALDQITADQSDGAIRTTGRELDLAILGPGEFTYQTPAGPAYTRNGAFHQDRDGQLVTTEGFPVLMDGAPLRARGQNVTIGADATVYLDGVAAGRLQIRGTDSPRIQTGALESSNVALAQEMTNLVTALRSFQVNQRAFQMQNQTLEKVVSEIGRL